MKMTEPKMPADGDTPDVRDKWEKWVQKMEQVTGLAELIVAKQRHGATGKVRLRFEARITRFSDLAPEELADQSYSYE